MLLLFPVCVFTSPSCLMCVFSTVQSVTCVMSLSQPLLSSSSSSSSSPSHVHCLCVRTCIFYFILFGAASVSPCWQKGITAPGTESCSLASGWRSTWETKRMLVHLKVAADLPVDVFAVTLNGIFNPGWFGFHFSRIPTESVVFTFAFFVCFGLLVVALWF